MALCLANSLIARRDFVAYDQLVRYKWWYRHGYMSSTGHCFDIGSATRQSIQEFETRQRKFAQDHNISGEEIDSLSDPKILSQFDVKCSKSEVAGNGALMRLAPVPLFFYRDPEKAIEYSGQSGQITHGDKKAYDACRYYGALIVATLQGATKEELLSDTFYKNHEKWFGSKVLHEDIMNIIKGSFKKQGGYEEGIRGKGYVVNALEAALWAFWSDNDSFEKGALNAVNLGDDTDTTAAIYGQLAGAYYGFQKLPTKWVDSVYAKHFLQCISHWIIYEGAQWFKNQKSSVVVKPTNYSNVKSATTAPNIISNSIQKVELNSHKQSDTVYSSVYTSLATMDRKAIDSNGRIGSFYDGQQDRIVKSLDSCVNKQIKQLNFSATCFIENGDNSKCRNLLRLIGFDDELPLSIASDIVLPKGTSLYPTI
ncbi:unnamed protein product [Rotaria sordida]|uniref:ADP-ribosylhydrolase ARH3 n=1 Tax=Rotaria sordida TaxID=392033 RepID=A0A815H4X3_9BILA|nr:unnamed protein product [Rotaria sordida]CAF1599992.1 unnamed protein product [Rotaria sordida]